MGTSNSEHFNVLGTAIDSVIPLDKAVVDSLNLAAIYFISAAGPAADTASLVASIELNRMLRHDVSSKMQIGYWVQLQSTYHECAPGNESHRLQDLLHDVGRRTPGRLGGGWDRLRSPSTTTQGVA